MKDRIETKDDEMMCKLAIALGFKSVDEWCAYFNAKKREREK